MFEAARIHFLSDVFAAVSVVVAQLPIIIGFNVNEQGQAKRVKELGSNQTAIPNKDKESKIENTQRQQASNNTNTDRDAEKDLKKKKKTGNVIYPRTILMVKFKFKFKDRS